ncbi:GNAT family N-acetyltransferase [Psychrobacillus sp.]|uniref:GNAT family N-acetyltransferase n=1 Tax=Psychrobacillus sp. TaxID=1871623 RepID=UPI0028BDE9A0|nr:GNAT family N-acetyltransferase [Psychrobacillus sp.]
MIERATESDLEFILSRAVESTMEGAQIRGSIKKEKAIQMFQSILANGGLYLVEKDEEGAILGWILVGENTDYFTDKKHGFIYDLHALHEHRGKGLSKQLLDEGMAFLKSLGHDEVRLNVYSSNFAKEIYAKMGFTELNCIMVASLNES